MLIMAKKKIKIHGLDLLRVFVYVILTIMIVAVILALVDGATTVKNLASSSIQVAADSSSSKATACKTGETIYGINNYPYTSTPTENGAHKKYTDKMVSGTWKCSNVCGPSDAKKFVTEFLPSLTVDEKAINIVADRDEFDKLVDSISGKDEILDRTVIADYSLLRKNTGCFGPSDDYKNLKGATVAKENTTIADQKAAQAAKSVTTTAIAGTAAQDTTNKDDTFKAPGTSGSESSSGNTNVTTRSKSASYKGLNRCWAQTGTLLIKIGDGEDGANYFLNNNKDIQSDFLQVAEKYTTLKTSKTWGSKEEASAAATLNTCNGLNSKLAKVLRGTTANEVANSTASSQIKIATRIILSQQGILVSKKKYWAKDSGYVENGTACLVLISGADKKIITKCTKISDGKYKDIAIDTSNVFSQTFGSNAGDQIIQYAYDPGKLLTFEKTKYNLSAKYASTFLKENTANIKSGNLTIAYAPHLVEFKKGAYGNYAKIIAMLQNSKKDVWNTATLSSLGL